MFGRPKRQERVIEIAREERVVPLLIGYAAEGREDIKASRQFLRRAGEVGLPEAQRGPGRCGRGQKCVGQPHRWCRGRMGALGSRSARDDGVQRASAAFQSAVFASILLPLAAASASGRIEAVSRPQSRSALIENCT